ncbi:MAG: hypothetical protein S4CHLAM6_06520 [Chlamydiae bacterium]|nr:hypothetical protein [Chlamydiota bacterium]
MRKTKKVELKVTIKKIKKMPKKVLPLSENITLVEDWYDILLIREIVVC